MALFIDRVQLPQGYSHFEGTVYFLPLSPQKFLAQKDERLSRPWSHPVVLNMGPGNSFMYPINPFVFKFRLKHPYKKAIAEVRGNDAIRSLSLFNSI